MLRDVQGQCKCEERWHKRNILNSAIYISSWDTENIKILRYRYAPRFLWVGWFVWVWSRAGARRGCIYSADHTWNTEVPAYRQHKKIG